jgi:hypothetical protein
MIVQQYKLSPWVLLPAQVGLLIGVAALRLRKPTVPEVVRTGKHPALIEV